MLYQGDTGLYLSGAPVPIPQCALYITQPKVRDIALFGESNFLFAVYLLARTEDYVEQLRVDNSELETKTDFQLLMIMTMQDEHVKRYLDTFFELTFPEYSVEYTLNAINFRLRDSEEKSLKGMINIYTFSVFQTVVRELFISDSESSKDFNPASEAASAIAKKLKKGRERANKDKGANDENVSLFGTYASILAIGMQMDINIFYNYTPFQIMDAFKRYWLKSRFDLDQKIRTTPMMDTSGMEDPEEWTQNFYPSK